MPLTKRQFELGVDEEGEELMRRVYRLSSSNPELAYSLEEIISMIRAEDLSSGENQIEKALGVLVGIGAMEGREIGYNEYFAFLQDFDTGTWMSTKYIKS